MATTPAPHQAPAPFCRYGSADVILQSSDQYGFYVHKLVLGLASPFFNQMFSLSQPISAPLPTSPPSTSAEPLPIIPVTEDRDTIDYLLRLCYPITDPTPPTDVGIVVKILEAAMKYELEEATEILRKLFISFIPTLPLKVFAHACQLRLENEATEAAKYWRSQSESNRDRTLCIPSNHSVASRTVHPCSSYSCVFNNFQNTKLGSTWVDEMKEISAGCLHRLLRFVRTGEIATFCDPPSLPATDSPSNATDLGISHLLSPNVVLRSSDMKLIPTHRVILEYAGATELFRGIHIDSSSASPEELPVVDMEADESTILNLLRICQPLAIDVITNKTLTLGELHNLWSVAHKYGMTRVMEVIRLSWTHHAEGEPLGLYFAALKYGWAEEAKRAADWTTKFPLFEQGGYTPEMELVSAQALRSLYQFQHDYRKAGATISEQYRANQVSIPLETDSSNTAALPLVLIPALGQYHTSRGCGSSCCTYQLLRGQDQGSVLQRSNALLKQIKAATLNVALQAWAEQVVDPR